jgi:hypothetical protein
MDPLTCGNGARGSVLSRVDQDGRIPDRPIPVDRRRRAAGAPLACIAGRRRSARRLPTRDSGQRLQPALTRRRPRPARPPCAPPRHETAGQPRRRPGRSVGRGPGGAASHRPWRSRPRRLHRSSGTTRGRCGRCHPCGRSSAPRERGASSSDRTGWTQAWLTLGSLVERNRSGARAPGVRFPMPAARCGRSGAAAAPGPAAGCR